MAEYTADFELGANGSAVLVADTGSATPWDNVTLAGSTAITYSNTHKYGTLAAKIVCDSTPNLGYLEWDSSTLGVGTLTTVYGRMYVYLPSGHDQLLLLYRGLNNAGTRAFETYLSATNRLLVRDNAGNTVGTSSASVSLNQWVRIEYKVVNSVGAGQHEVKLFNSAESSTPTETITGAGVFSTLTNTSYIRMGVVASGKASATYYFDNLLLNDTGYPGPAPGAPANTVTPVASGTATVGQTLSVTDGTWTGSPSFTYQWQRDDDGDSVFANISSATANSYTLADADDSSQVRCVVTGTNVNGTVQADSNTLGPVVQPVPVNTVVPVVSGTAHFDRALDATTGTWSNMTGDVATYGYQWQQSANGTTGWANITGATESRYQVEAISALYYVRVVITATNTGGAVTANSVATDQVPALDPDPVPNDLYVGFYLYPDGAVSYPGASTYPGEYEIQDGTDPPIPPVPTVLREVVVLSGPTPAPPFPTYYSRKHKRS